MRTCLVMAGLAGLAAVAAGAERVAGFDDLALAGAGVAAYAGPGGGVYWNGVDRSGGFESGGVWFENAYTDWGGGYYSWAGWAYSTTADRATAGFGNQYSAFAGGAHSGAVYAVTYAPSVIRLPAGWRAPVSVAVTNSTYAALSMRDGDDYSKKFGLGDWFRLTVTGVDAAGNELGGVAIYLGDFRTAESPGILDRWIELPLGSLGGAVAELRFTLESTDNGQFGMNTPGYVAVDTLVLGPTPAWGGYDLRPDGWADTGAFLGWVYPAGEYVYVLKLGKWVYLPSEWAAGASGSWAYIPR